MGHSMKNGKWVIQEVESPSLREIRGVKKRLGEKNLDASSILFGWMTMLSFRRGNAGEREGLGRTRERRGRGNEFHFGRFELEVSVDY